MREVFAKRRRDFRNQSIKYLRYVLNDHFVLFLMVFLGFTAVQYSQLLRNFPKNHLPIWLALAILSLGLVFMGRIATYLEGPDSLFLLAKEKEVRVHVGKQTRNSFILWGILQSIVLLLLTPLFLALGVPTWAFALYCLLLFALKGLVFQWKSQKFYLQEGLDWKYLIAYEERRKQRILQFFALFTNVKGISSSVKRRAYLDFLTNHLVKSQEKVWDHLFLRSYLRNGDFFALSLRLLILSLLIIVFLPQSTIASIFVGLFQYLLLFQLLALYDAFDYQYLTKLFPLEQKVKLVGLRRIITAIGTFVLILELLAALLFFQDRIMTFIILGIHLLLYVLYLPFKLNRLVD